MTHTTMLIRALEQIALTAMNGTEGYAHEECIIIANKALEEVCVEVFESSWDEYLKERGYL